MNLSAEHFLDSAIVDRIQKLIEEGRGRSSRLQIEITETLLINRAKATDDPSQPEYQRVRSRRQGLSDALNKPTQLELFPE